EQRGENDGEPPARSLERPRTARERLARKNSTKFGTRRDCFSGGPCDLLRRKAAHDHAVDVDSSGLCIVACGGSTGNVALFPFDCIVLRGGSVACGHLLGCPLFLQSGCEVLARAPQIFSKNPRRNRRAAKTS